MKAKDLLALTAGQHALQAALCAKLETALDECDATQDGADYLERCLREIANQILMPNQAIMPNQPMWPSRVVEQTVAHVQGLRDRVVQLEASLSSACAKVQQ
jgi:hypothetical protein